ncbi:hypothetical protein [Sphingobium sp.]|uniref:hypothetical protein n=1 Tax=Sphingobium sp. TaxID=1912891 RepID=UPI002D175B20|nr:hypothetical protein [Sphingobium sp.]HUD92305.1 hypothetical protein [Sphingobium sp.]
MSGADWQVGDLAMCIRSGKWIDVIARDASSGPAPGSIHVVDEIGQAGGTDFLGFPEWPEDFFGADAFRKIEPLSDLERLRAETDFHVSKNLARRRARQVAL